MIRAIAAATITIGSLAFPASAQTQIAGANVNVAPGQWHLLTLRPQGDRFTVSFDGKQLYTAQDGTFGGPGQIALWTKADSVTHFDTITITALP